MIEQSPLSLATTQFRVATYQGRLTFANERERVCHDVEPKHAAVLGLSFNADKAQFTREGSGVVYAGFYRTSLSVGIQIADPYVRSQKSAQTELQAILSEKQARGELNNVTVLVKNPFNNAPMGWNIQNMLVEIDGIIFVATRKGVIVRPYTETPRKDDSSEREIYVASEFKRRREEIDESKLKVWDTQECKPSAN